MSPFFPKFPTLFSYTDSGLFSFNIFNTVKKSFLSLLIVCWPDINADLVCIHIFILAEQSYCTFCQFRPLLRLNDLAQYIIFCF